MATYKAISTGVYSALARWEVWDGMAWIAAGVLPTVADEVYANGFTVTIDVDSFASTYQNGAASGIAVGGHFVLASGVTMIGDIIVGNVAGNSDAVNVLSGDSFIVGNVIHGVIISVGNGVHGVSKSTAGTLTIIGDVLISGSLGFGNINSAVRIIGNTAVIIVVGNSTSINATFNRGCNNTGASVNQFEIRGRAIGSVGNGRLGAFNCVIYECESANQNCVVVEKFIMPTTNAPIWVNCLAKIGANIQIEIYDELGAAVLCNPLYAQNQASPADVRLNTAYANGALTGTAAIPPAASVALNVPVDATVGTMPTSAVIAADLLNEISTSNNALAERLRNVSTVQTTGTQISALTIS